MDVQTDIAERQAVLRGYANRREFHHAVGAPTDARALR